jgi:sigma-B regulation protein RsbU (phosphoserine phosphatase)
VLTRLNRTLAASQVESSFVTAFVGLYDPVKRTLLHSSAGHPPPLVRSTGSEARTLARFGGIPLGIIEDTEFEEGATQLASGDTLVMYSDGIVEAMSPEHDMFGLDGIATAVRECSGYAECSIDSILRDVRAFERGTRPTDDQTLVVMRIT